jgi:hypothetical protein
MSARLAIREMLEQRLYSTYYTKEQRVMANPSEDAEDIVLTEGESGSRSLKPQYIYKCMHATMVWQVICDSAEYSFHHASPDPRPYCLYCSISC